MEAGIKVGLHNKFDIEVRDAKTNELKQSATAYNIVLNQLWARVLARNTFMSAIHIGTGTGDLSPSRTTLFTFLFGRNATLDGTSFNINNMYRRVKIQIEPNEYVGQTFTEVGVAFGTTNTNLCTHAMLTDAEGNPISILKTDTDVVIIYATVFFTVGELDDGVKLAGVDWDGNVSGNNLLAYLINQSGGPETNIRLGTYGDVSAPHIGASLRGRQIATKTATITTDAENKRIIFPVRRFEISEANGHIQEISIGGSFNIQLPNDNYIGTQYNDVSLTGNNGALTTFLIPSANVDPDTIIVKVNNVETEVDVLEVPYYKQYVPTTGLSSSSFFVFSDDVVVHPTAVDVSWDGTQFIRTNNNAAAIGSDTNISLARRSDNTLVFINDTTRIRFRNLTTGASAGTWTESSDTSNLHKVSEDVYVWFRYITFGQQWRGNTFYTLDGGDTWFQLSDYKYSITATNCASNVKRITMYGTTYSKFNIDTATWQNLTINGANTSHRAWAFTSDDSIMVSYSNAGGIRSYHEVSDLVWESDSVIESVGDTNIYTSGWFIDDEWLLMCNASVATLWHFDGEDWVRLFFEVPRATFMDLTDLPDASSGNVSPLGNTVSYGNVNNGALGIKSTGKFYIKFDTPPAAEDDIKVSYKVNGIHKTTNYVLDVNGYIEFGEG